MPEIPFISPKMFPLPENLSRDLMTTCCCPMISSTARMILRVESPIMIPTKDFYFSPPLRNKSDPLRTGSTSPRQFMTSFP